MIDNLSLAISHGLMLLAAWLLLRRPDLDDESGTGNAGFFKRRRDGNTGGDKPGA